MDYNKNKSRKELGVMEQTKNPTIEEQVQEVLDKLRPFIQRDGGDIELVAVEDGVVKVRLMGACGSCPASTITLKAGVERALMEEVPGIVEVEQVL
jgi:Fe-S cluster biogenesis protein NfuA